MILNTYQKVCIGFFIILVIFWGALFASGARDGFYNYSFVFLYGLIPLVGGAIAVKGYRVWGGLSTILGRAILFMGLGLFLWGCGGAVWSFYNFFFHVEIPYPSLADLFFVPSVFFYTIGTVLISMTTGARIGLSRASGKIFTAIAVMVAFALAYYTIVVIGHGGQLVSDSASAMKMLLDIAYPFGDAVSLAAALVVAGLSFRYLGGVYKYDIIFILSGLAVMFAADSSFSYATIVGTYYNGGVTDLLFTIGLFLLTCGILGFNKIKNAGSGQVAS